MKDLMYMKIEKAEQLLESLTQDLSTHMANNRKEDIENVAHFIEYQKEALYKLKFAKCTVHLMKGG
jgi:hypothetical protein